MNRQDLGPEGNEARRKFWEMCASRAPIRRLMPLRDLEDQEGMIGERSEDSALWADYMLAEWDKRWIAEEETDKALTSIASYIPLFLSSEEIRIITEMADIAEDLGETGELDPNIKPLAKIISRLTGFVPSTWRVRREKGEKK